MNYTNQKPQWRLERRYFYGNGGSTAPKPVFDVFFSIEFRPYCAHVRLFDYIIRGNMKARLRDINK